MILNDYQRRPNTSDEYVEQHIRQDYGRLRINEGDTVIDLGAHIGLFTNMALERGATKVVCVEPNPWNLESLRRHTTGLPVTVIAGAVVDRPQGPLPFYMKQNGHQSGGSLEPARTGRDITWVDSIPFADLMGHAPNVVKCDIEGGEFDLPLGDMPDCVRAFAIELHFRKKRWRTTDAPRLLTSLSHAGWLDHLDRTPLYACASVLRNRAWNKVLVLHR